MKINPVKIVVLGKEGQLARSLRVLTQGSELNIAFVSSKEVDLSVPEKLDQFFKNLKYDILVNTSAYTMVDKAEEEKDKAYAINAVSVKKLAEITKRNNSKLIHFSTDYVYGDNGSSFLSEESETLPVNYYGFTKLQGEKFIAESGARNLIFRTSWVFAPWGNNFLRTMLRLGAEREVVKIVSDQIGAPTYAPALAQAILSIIEKWNSVKQDGVYNLSGPDTYSWCQFARLIFDRASELKFQLKIKNILPISSIEYPVPAPRPMNSRMSLEKVKGAFAVTMPSLQESVDDCLRKIREEQTRIKSEGDK